MVLFNLQLRGVIHFPKGISPKVNIIAWMQFELTHSDVMVQHVSHYETSTSPAYIWLTLLMNIYFLWNSGVNVYAQWISYTSTMQKISKFLLYNSYIYIYIYIVKVKLGTVVEGNLKAPFSMATTPRCRGEYYSFPWIFPLYSWYVTYDAECQSREFEVPFFESLIWLVLGLNPGPPDHWRTLYSQDRYIYK